MKRMMYIVMLLSLLIGDFALAQTRFDSLDVTLTRSRDRGSFNGIVLIGSPDSVMYSKSYGYADYEKKSSIDQNTQFYIASISKQFTAASILILFEQNKIRLDQPVRDILVDFPYEKVTPHHLLSNTSGIPDYIDYFAAQWNKRKQANTDDVIDALPKFGPELNFEPGSQFEYSNVNFVILAKIIEVISKQSYPSFLENHLFKSCGMNQTYATYKPYFTAQDSNVAYGYVVENGMVQKAENSKKDYMDRVNYLSGIQGDGSVVTTIHDLFLWNKSLYSNQLLLKSTTDLMYQQNRLNDGTFSHYGYGWYTDGKFADHTGSWPGYQARIIQNLKNGKVGISLKNVEVDDWRWIAEFDQLLQE